MILIRKELNRERPVGGFGEPDFQKDRGDGRRNKSWRSGSGRRCRNAVTAESWVRKLTGIALGTIGVWVVEAMDGRMDGPPLLSVQV